jgi:hypothetical protein
MKLLLAVVALSLASCVSPVVVTAAPRYQALSMRNELLLVDGMTGEAWVWTDHPNGHDRIWVRATVPLMEKRYEEMPSSQPTSR